MKRIICSLAAVLFLLPAFSQKSVMRWSEKAGSSITTKAHLEYHIIDNALQTRTTGQGIAGFSVTIPAATQDVSTSVAIDIPVSNTGSTDCIVDAYLEDKIWIAASAVLKPGESDFLQILFIHKVDTNRKVFPDMEGVPGGNLSIYDPIDPVHLKGLRFEIRASAPAAVSFGNITGEGAYFTGEQMAAKAGFFPFVDQYGQYKHSEWPGKTHTDADLEKDLQEEEAVFALLSGPASFDDFGGWKDGPQLAATGNFRVQKVNGKWWMVDPAGHLFWSHGIDCVGFGSGSTKLSGLENYFEQLPAEDGPSKVAYMTGRKQKTINFYTANLVRKFGDDWKKKAIGFAHQRLKSWGVNTIGNWSDPEVYLIPGNRIPYTANVGYRSPALDGASYKFPDVFDPRFKSSLDSSAAKAVTRTVKDPWCIGYFIDNELKLGDYTAAIMNQSPAGHAKLFLLTWLKRKYGLIGNLNKAYRSNFSSWETLAAEKELPAASGKDRAAFNEVVVDRYYATCRAAIKKAAPQKLYLGSRFNLYRILYPADTSVSYTIRAAARYCDVVSINYYRYGSKDLVLPPGSADKPILIGEFHFGAMDRGLPHTGLRNTASQEQRARWYQTFLEQALQNPGIVGAHWFQYGDEPYTGRSDGENYQIGFVDVCDRPYPETVKAIRNIGYNQYTIRSTRNSAQKP